jgi:hypothetical protein
MARDNGIGGRLKLAIDHVKIGTADAARQDFH